MLDQFEVITTLSFVDTYTHRLYPGSKTAAPNDQAVSGEVLRLIPATNHRPVSTRIRVGTLVPDSLASSRSRLKPRQIVPKRADQAAAATRFNDALAKYRRNNPPPTLDPTTDAECDALLAWCHEAYTKASNSSYPRPRHQDRVNPNVLRSASPELKAAVELREKNQRAQLVLDQLLEARPGAHWHDEESRGRLRRHRQVCNRRHRKAHRAHFLNATAAKQKELFGRALNGGPFRHLFVARVVTNPPHLIEPSTRGSDDERLVHKAQDKLRTWSDCFSSLLSTPEPPIADKWWMDSATSHRARQAAAADPFEWPQLMRTEDLRRVLGRGIPRPAPGPDGWEKWIFRQADIGFLGLVTAIANYCLRTSYFPDHLRQNHLMPVHKRGDVTERSNYRGVTHANCLYQASMAWYTSRLQEYIWRRRLISPTQVVGKQGVQPGDLMQFLEQLDTAARLNGQTVHILKRDHIKGFDNLHPSAIEDALTFFGFPRSVVEFEKARTANTSLFVKTQDGIATQPIMTDGQTKQGDPASPLKYALAMSILPACLSVVPGLAEAAATVRTVNGRHDTINVPADRVALTVPIVEAMDDSLLLASSENDLGGLLEVPGAFQRALWGPNSVEQSWEDPSKTSFAPPPRPTWAAALKELTTAEEPTRHASSGSTKTTSINGPPARTSIDICVFGLPHHHQDSAINHVESAIVSLPSLKLEALVLSIGDPGAPQNVPQSTVTIKWAPRKWLQPDLDLASELDDVRKALLSDGRLPSWLPAA